MSKIDFSDPAPAEDQNRLSGVDEQQAMQGRLDRFSGALAGELLAGGVISVDGLGTFSVIHEHAKRETTTSGSRFLPPCNRVIFDPRPTARGESARIAAERLDLNADEASRFAKSLTDMFERSRKQSIELRLSGFGSFTMIDGHYGFRPDPSFEELLNSAYDGLKTIDIQERQDLPVSGGEKSSGNFNKVAAAIIAAVLLAGGGYFLTRQHSPERSVPSVVTTVSSPVTPTAANVSIPVVPARNIAAAEPDSVTLDKGRFTVIAATFSSLKTVRQELQRLSELGHKVRIWPVTDSGTKYYRLVIGDFDSQRSASDSVKTMPRGLSKNIYIQQAPKNVVLYGENGL
ncbi:MAG: SPOR domain-containing protein [Chlorobiaceae bacterium]|nr:SPOR domain-containing protein [Chlorobiaceae bacterium]